MQRCLAGTIVMTLLAACSEAAPGRALLDPGPTSIAGQSTASGLATAGMNSAAVQLPLAGSTVDNPSATATGSAGMAAPPAQPSAGDGAGKCGAVTQMAKNMRQPVDLIFGVDTTGSMLEEITFTEENMNAFSQQITNAGIDVHLIMISTAKDGAPPFPHVDGVCLAAPLGSGSCPSDAKSPGYVHIPQPLADWDILQNYIDLYPMYKQYLRENAFKTFVSISDGDIAGNPILQLPINSADLFINAVRALEPKSQMWSNWRYSAIYSFSACGIGNSPGVVHADLVKRTQGVGGDLCLQNFKPVFDDLAKQVVNVVTLACDWQIPPTPQGEKFDPGKTNVQLTLEGKPERLGKAATAQDCGMRDGWHYDLDTGPQRVVACPSTCTRIQAAREAQIDLLFGCKTVELPPLF